MIAAVNSGRHCVSVESTSIWAKVRVVEALKRTIRLKKKIRQKRVPTKGKPTKKTVINNYYILA